MLKNDTNISTVDVTISIPDPDNEAALENGIPVRYVVTFKDGTTTVGEGNLSFGVSAEVALMSLLIAADLIQSGALVMPDRTEPAID